MKHWPHAPIHLLEEQGAYMVTCGTFLKIHHLCTPDRLDLVQTALFDVADEYAWRLQAWSVLSNHYHFVASSPQNPVSLKRMLSKLHTTTAKELNRQDGKEGRQVWYQYWDSHITYRNSYYARLKYVHENPVHHGVVENAENYPWCSAAWFARGARRSFYKTIMGFKVDRVKVADDFDVVGIDGVRESGVEPPHSERGRWLKEDRVKVADDFDVVGIDDVRESGVEPPHSQTVRG